jgi:integrase
VFTGLRAGELACLRWQDIDFAKRLITVQRSFNGPTKNGEVRYVPILNVLLPILISLKNENHNTEFVFVTKAGTQFQESARVFQEILKRVLKNAGLVLSSPKGRKKGYIVFHDLRHTFASYWMMKGGNIFKLQKILGHKSPQMTQRYAHLEPGLFVEDHKIFGVGGPLIKPAKLDHSLARVK